MRSIQLSYEGNWLAVAMPADGRIVMHVAPLSYPYRVTCHFGTMTLFQWQCCPTDLPA